MGTRHSVLTGTKQMPQGQGSVGPTWCIGTACGETGKDMETEGD